MEVFMTETQDVVRRFRHHQLTFETCISRLDAALARFIPRMRPEDLPQLRTVMLANNDAVMTEMAQRESPDPIHPAMAD